MMHLCLSSLFPALVIFFDFQHAIFVGLQLLLSLSWTNISSSSSTTVLSLPCHLLLLPHCFLWVYHQFHQQVMLLSSIESCPSSCWAYYNQLLHFFLHTPILVSKILSYKGNKCVTILHELFSLLLVDEAYLGRGSWVGDFDTKSESILWTL